jgi:hypothetical protein
MHWEQMDFKTELTVCSSPVSTRPDKDLQDVGGTTLAKQADCFGCVFVSTYRLALMKKAKLVQQ